MYLPYSRKFSKVQNFSVKLIYFPEEILEELNSKVNSYIIPHEVEVAYKPISYLSLTFGNLMV